MLLVESPFLSVLPLLPFRFHWGLQQSAIGRPPRVIRFTFWLHPFRHIVRLTFFTNLYPSFRLFVFHWRIVSYSLMFFRLPKRILRLQGPLFRRKRNFLFLLSNIRQNGTKRGHFGNPHLFKRISHLFRRPNKSVLPTHLTNTFPALRIKMLLRRANIGVILPLHRVNPITSGFFNTRTIILYRQRGSRIRVKHFFVRICRDQGSILPTRPIGRRIHHPLRMNHCLL